MLGTAGNSITLLAGASTVNLTTNDLASATSTNEDDTVTATAAGADGDTVDLLLGTDSLSITDDTSTVDLTNAAGGQALDINLDNAESVVFNNQTGAVTVAGRNNGEDITVNGADSALVVTATAANQDFVVNNTTVGGAASTITFSGAASQTATTGSADDIFNAIQNGDEVINSGAGDDTFNVLAVGDFVAGLTINGGTGTNSIVLADAQTGALSLVTPAFSGIEAFNAGQVAGGGLAVTLDTGFTTLAADTTNGAVDFTGTGAQLSALTSITNTDGTNVFDLTASDAATTVDLTGLATVGGTGGDIDVITFTGNNNTLKVDAVNVADISGTVVAAGTGDTLQVNDTLTLGGAVFDAFEVITITGSGANLTNGDANAAQTINGEAGDNDIILADSQAAADTVNISQGGVDRVSFDGVGDDTTATGVTGFTAGSGAGADVIDLNTTGAIGADVTTGIAAGTGFTIDTAAAANAIDNAVVLGSTGAQISGALTATGDAGAVEQAIISGGLIFDQADGVDEQAADGHFYAILDNGTATGIYRVVTANGNIGDNNLNAANEFAVTLVGTVDVADASTFVAANFI
jgi:hypothetical protein